MADFIGKKISELKGLLDSGEVSAVEIADSFINHIESHDGETNAFLTVTAELARQQAGAVDKLRAAGETLPRLAGVPVAIKDNICVEGYPTTCASKILENFKPHYTATAAARLFDAGALCVGKGNLDEFAMGSSSENTAFAVPTNPWDRSRVPGGSSGGPAIAVSAGYSTVGIGSDTGGSIRLPASFCGVVGMKPTYGIVSRFGLVAFASSLDQIGPFASCVEDAALALSVLAGPDDRDSTSIKDISGYDKFDPTDQSFVESLKTGHSSSKVKGMRIGMIKELLSEGIQPQVRDAVDHAIKLLEGLGAAVEEVSLPHINNALPVYYLIATAEASANLARYDGVRYGERAAGVKDMLSLYNRSRQEGFGDEVKRRIMLGTYALSTGYYDAYYKKAQQVRRLLKESIDSLFEKVDLLVCPTSPTVAFAIGEKTEDPLSMYLCDIATIPANLAGLPALSLPFGFGEGGMPIGFQIMGPQLADSLVLTVAHALEHEARLPQRLPPMVAGKSG